VCTPEQTHVIPLGFDLRRFTENQTQKRSAFRREFGIEEDELAIGIIGRLAPIKNHFLFIDAFNYICGKTKRKLRAIIIGDGEMRKELEDYIQKLPRENAGKFLFTSWIREVDVALAGLDLVCLTSRNEGTPVSLIEAQAASRFVISTNVGGIEDILDPRCGLLSAPDDEQSYCINLLQAVERFDEYSVRAGEGSKKILEDFSHYRL
jgi:glycosyltransferase involved in cell wall biosynthesis